MKLEEYRKLGNVRDVSPRIKIWLKFATNEEIILIRRPFREDDFEPSRILTILWAGFLRDIGNSTMQERKKERREFFTKNVSALFMVAGAFGIGSLFVR